MVTGFSRAQPEAMANRRIAGAASPDMMDLAFMR
jgi:hypothetical protein